MGLCVHQMLCLTPAYLVDSVCIRHCVKEWERVSNNRKPVKRRSTYKVNTEATVKSSRMGVWKIIPETLYFRKWKGCLLFYWEMKKMKKQFPFIQCFKSSPSKAKFLSNSKCFNILSIQGCILIKNGLFLKNSFYEFFLALGHLPSPPTKEGRHFELIFLSLRKLRVNK